MSSIEAGVWIARPQDVSDDQMRAFECTLDANEKERALKFRFESDRRAYVVAHGLRRLVLGELLNVDPCRLVLLKLMSGKPKLIWPVDSHIFFSHAHTRDVVAFAATTRGPVGVDAEYVVDTAPDFDLLKPYVALPEVSQRNAELGPNSAEQFFFYWTVLEAFWKAEGKGLSPENPRIRCEKSKSGNFEVTLEEGSIGSPRNLPRARVARIQAPAGCLISFVQQDLQDATLVAGVSSVVGIDNSSKKSGFSHHVERYTDSDFIKFVSVERQEVSGHDQHKCDIRGQRKSFDPVRRRLCESRTQGSGNCQP